MRLQPILFTAFLLLSGCAAVQQMMPPTEAPVVDHSPTAIEREVNALFDQPYIDPLTRYLEQHTGNLQRATQLPRIRQERDRRCTEIAARYAERPKTTESLELYRRGYEYSCPADVAAFAAEVEAAGAAGEAMARVAAPPQRPAPAPATDETNRNECYLLTDIRNFSEAQEVCRVSADEGDLRAQLNMALIAQALRDYPQALAWARPIADSSAEARYLLGQLYASGHGVERDYAGALTWYQRAANEGYAPAQTALGTMFLQGRGVSRNPLTAQQWFLKAARQDEGQAQYQLGQMSEQGILVEQDLMLALAWYDLSSRNGIREARARVEALNRSANPEEFAQAQAAVRRMLDGQP